MADTPASLRATLEQPPDSVLEAAFGETAWAGGPTHFAGRYEILGLLGAGGMGSVYRARDVKLDEVVALKVVRPELARPDMLEHFQREVKLGRRVTHRNVARVFDLGEDAGVSYLTMELVDGESLGALLERHGALPADYVVSIARELCEALSAAHAAGVVHRDLKPDNVIVTPEGRIVITDFGIASPPEMVANRSGPKFFGTPAYMAPEQVDRRSAVDGRADLYALGVLLFEAVTGTLPWVAETPLATAVARLLSAPPDPRSVADVPVGLAGVIVRLMARDPEHRYASATETSQALAQLVSPAQAPSLPARGASTALARRTRIVVLPLRSRSSDDELSAGLTQDLVDGLSVLAGISVVAHIPDSTAELDLKRLARDLDVAIAIMGTAQRIGRATIRMTLRAVGTTDGVQLWAKRFEHPEAEMLTMNDLATRDIASALELAQLPSSRTLTDAGAIALYLKARARFRGMQRNATAEALSLLETALARSPDSPMLLSAYAAALARRYFFTGQGEADARAMAERALAVEPQLAEAHFALASIDFASGKYEACAVGTLGTLARNPALAEAHLMRARLLLEIGSLDEALEGLRTTAELDRGLWLTFTERARLHALRGSWLDVDVTLDSSLEAGAAVDPRVTRLIHRLRLAIWRGDAAHLATTLAEMDEIESGGGVSNSAFELARELGRCLRHRRHFVIPASMRVASDNGTRRSAYFHQISAEIATHLGDDEAALAHVERAANATFIDLAWLDRCPVLERVRPSDRFQSVRLAVVLRVEPTWRVLCPGQALE